MRLEQVEIAAQLDAGQVEIMMQLNAGEKTSLAKVLAARWPYERSASAFEALVKELRFPWDHYAPYLRNLRQRYKLGTTN